MDAHEREEAAIGAAVSHLVRRFGDTVPPGELEATVRECYGMWPDARVRDFVPVLAERRARERLDQAARRR
jgi:erythromycin esterase-like protein